MRHGDPSDSPPNPDSHGASQEEVMLILMSTTKGTCGRLNDIPMMQKGHRRKPVVVHKPKEVLTTRDGSVVPDEGSEVVDRPLFHMPCIKPCGG